MTCITGDQFQKAMETLGIWYDGDILSVKLQNRTSNTIMTGHFSDWYVEVEVSADPPSEPYEVRVIRIPMHCAGHICNEKS